MSNRILKQRASISLATTILLFVLPNVLTAQEICKAKTVKMVTYAKHGEDKPAGTIKLAHNGNFWVDKSSNILNTWKEQRRDDWSVVLVDARNQNSNMQINLYNRQVLVNGQVVYKILTASTTVVNGKNAKEVTYGLVGQDGHQHGKFVQSDAKTWVAKHNFGLAGDTKFKEVSRDDWSVHLAHEHGMRAQIDLYQNEIKFSHQYRNFGFAASPMRVLTATADTKTAPKANPSFTLVVEAIWCAETSEYSDDETYLSFPTSNSGVHAFDDNTGWEPNHKVAFKNKITMKLMEQDDGRIAPGISDPDDELGSFIIQPIVTKPTSVVARGDGSHYIIRYRVDKN